MTVADDITPIGPWIRAKARATCPHLRFVVSMTEADLECDACGAKLDPWWLLRELANDAENVHARHEAMREELRMIEGALIARRAELATIEAEIRVAKATRTRLTRAR